MILSARAAGAMAAARLMHPGGTPPAAAPYTLAQRQVPPQSPYHQQQHQLAGLVPGPQQHRPAPAAASLSQQQGPYDVEVTPQVRTVLSSEP